MLNWIVASILTFWLGFNLLVVYLAVRPPRTPAICSPGVMGAPQQDVIIKSHDLIELSGWWVAGENPDSVAILCHGFCLSKGELSPVAYLLWEHGMSCLLFDFRAHGKSSGGTCSLGFHEKDDVVSAIDWIRKGNPNARIVLIGSSMGSVASALAWEENPESVQALVLDSAYANLGKAVNGWWRFLGGGWLSVLLWPAAFLGVLTLKVNPFAVKLPPSLKSLAGKPVLFMHGTDDKVVPAKEAGKNLLRLVPEPKRFGFPIATTLKVAGSNR